MISVSEVAIPAYHQAAGTLFHVLYDAKIASFVVYPCHKHTSILKELSHLFGVQPSQQNLTLICLDSNSKDLSDAHKFVRQEALVFNTKFKRHDPMTQPPPKAEVFVSIMNGNSMSLPWLEGLIRSIGRSGAERAVLRAWRVEGENGGLGDKVSETHFSCPLSILRIKPVHDSYIVVYDVRSFIHSCIDLSKIELDMKTEK